AACTIRVLNLSRLEARLPYQGRLLIAENAGDWDTSYRIELGAAVNLTFGANLRKNCCRNFEFRKNFAVPFHRFKVHHLRAAGIRDVCDVNPAGGAAAELPD